MNKGSDRDPIYTIGHSTRPIAEFVELLQAAGVQLLVDVRSIPRSRTNPQYNLDSLPATLSAWQIRHAIIPALGGRRNRQKEVPPEVNSFWTNQSFHNYADHALSEEFGRGLDQLIALNRQTPCAIMCAEAVWWRCHRRIIADHLLARGHSVLHLMGANKAEPATITRGAAMTRGLLTYPKVSNS